MLRGNIVILLAIVAFTGPPNCCRRSARHRRSSAQWCDREPRFDAVSLSVSPEEHVGIAGRPAIGRSRSFRYLGVRCRNGRGDLARTL